MGNTRPIPLLSRSVTMVLKLKAPLRGTRFHTQDIANTVQHEIVRLDNGAADGIGRLPYCWQLTVDCLGDYFEGC